MQHHNGECMQDFHTSVAGAMTDDEYVHALYNIMMEDAEQDLQAGVQRAAQRCVKKAELKVLVLPVIFSCLT